MTDIAAQLLSQATTLDPTLRDRVLALANASLDEAEMLIKHGDPKTKSMIVGKFLTIMANDMKVKEENEEIKELREGLKALTAAVNGHEVGAGGAEEGEAEVDKP